MPKGSDKKNKLSLAHIPTANATSMRSLTAFQERLAMAEKFRHMGDRSTSMMSDGRPFTFGEGHGVSKRQLKAEADARKKAADARKKKDGDKK